MAKESGVNVLVKIGNGASPEVFSVLKGQQTGQFAGTSDPIDVSDKTQDGWKSYLAGLRDASVTADGICDWPDTAGLEAIETAWLANEPISVQIILNKAGKGFEGLYFVTQYQVSGGYNDATKYSLQFSPSQAVAMIGV